MSEAKLVSNRNLSTLLRLSLTLLWRDWQGGELKLLFLALVMAVTSVSGIALFTDRLEQALLLESANMLAADRVLSGRREAPREWITEAESQGLQTAETISFTSMTFSDTGNMLVAAKAVSPTYPLRGELIAADAPFIRGTPIESGPLRGEVWLEARVLPALGIDVGDTVFVGESQLRVSKVIVVEPDRQQGGMVDNAGPRLMMNLADVEQTNVIQMGSRVSYRYLFAGDAETLETYGDWLREESSGQFRLRDVRDESEEVADALSKAESFLMLGSLFAVLLAGVAIALTAKRYSERHYDYVAILKTLGCTSNQITTIYVFIQIVLGTIAIIVGSILGWLVHHLILQALSSIILVDLPSASFQPFVIGALTAFICLLSFALPPLLALRHTSPLRVLRKDIDQQKIGANVPYLFGIFGSIFLVFWYSQDFVLTSVLVVSIAGIALFLSGVSFLLLHSSSSVGMKAGSAWKLAMSATRRRRKQNVLQVLVFSITIMSLLILTLLRTDLIDDWQAQLPENTPNHFLMNVTQQQVEGIQGFFRDNGIQENNFYPMLSARVNSVNGEPPRFRRLDEEEQRGSITERGAQDMQPEMPEEVEIEGEVVLDTDGEAQTQNTGRRPTRQITWTDQLPPDNLIIDGTWWDTDPQAGMVSVEVDYANSLGIEIGDQLEFEANQQTFEVEVQSIRTVRWDNMQPNFYFIFSPGTLDHLGATYLSTALMEQEQKLLLNDLLRLFPTIVVIEIDALIEQIQNIIAQVTSAIELISFLVLACGALVLLSCVNATLDERFRENAILRTLGAGRKLIMTSLLIEFASIGFIAGIIATIGAEGSLYYLQEFVFEQEFNLHYWVWIAGPAIGMTVIALLGVNSTRRVVNVSPLNVLRQV
jgi:putative ABC transport system permease protein